MKIKPEAILSAYFHSWWRPTAVCLGLAMVSIIMIGAVDILPWPPFVVLLYVLSGILIIGVQLSVLGILFAAFCQLYEKRWLGGLFNLAIFPVCGATLFGLAWGLALG